MNLYEFEGKQLFEKYGIKIPRGVVVRRNEDVADVFSAQGGSALGGKVAEVVVKAQVLSGKRGKNNEIRFCKTQEEVIEAVEDLFHMDVRGQYVIAVRIEEKLEIAEEQYLSIIYNTNTKQPMIIYSSEGGVDIEDVGEEKIEKYSLDIRNSELNVISTEAQRSGEIPSSGDEIPRLPSVARDDVKGIFQNLWNIFLAEDCRLVEINPLVRTTHGEWYAADAKVAIDDDAFYRHNPEAIERAKEKGKEVPSNWDAFEPRTMMGRQPTQREIAVQHIDTGEKYYQGTAGKYIEMDGDIAVLFSGGGASIANMDALKQNRLEPANYTEYSGNPPREKVYALAQIVLSKPGLRGLWIAGGVANFTNVEETFHGIVDALDEIKPTYPIVIRRAGPFEKEGMALMRACAERNGLNIKLFGKEVSMGETASILAEEVNKL